MEEVMTHSAGVLSPGHTARRLLAIAVLIGGTSLAACDSDPVDIDDDHVDGFAMYAGGVQIYNYRTSLHGATPDTLHLVAGQSYNVSFQWLNDEGHPTELEEDLELEVTVVNPAIVSWTQTGAASGTLVPVDVTGPVETAMRVILLHGGHSDFDTGNFTVRVAP